VHPTNEHDTQQLGHLIAMQFCYHKKLIKEVSCTFGLDTISQQAQVQVDLNTFLPLTSLKLLWNHIALFSAVSDGGM
jgi:hypothetical protein